VSLSQESAQTAVGCLRKDSRDTADQLRRLCGTRMEIRGARAFQRLQPHPVPAHAMPVAGMPRRSSALETHFLEEIDIGLGVDVCATLPEGHASGKEPVQCSIRSVRSLHANSSSKSWIPLKRSSQPSASAARTADSHQVHRYIDPRKRLGPVGLEESSSGRLGVELVIVAINDVGFRFSLSSRTT